MAKIFLKSIEVDDSGRLLLKPESGVDYAYIYRAAVGVNWSPELSCLFAPQPKEWSYVDWFENIYAAVRSEYGDQLFITSTTIWRNVPAELRERIMKSFSGIEERLQTIEALQRESGSKLARENEYRRISEQAAEAFRNKDLKKTVTLLSSAPSPLSPVDEKKLKYAHKKLES